MFLPWNSPHYRHKTLYNMPRTPRTLQPTVYWWNGDSIYKGDWDVFWQFRGQRRPIGIFHGGTFLTAFKMRSIWCILFLNRIGPSQYIRHSPQKIQEVVPGFRSWKLSPPKLAMIWRGVRCWREYQNDRLEKAVKKVPPWKISIGRLCPRNCQKPSQSPL